jgi:hypothetical protein
LRIDLVETTAWPSRARRRAAAFDELVRTCDRVVLELAERLLLDHHEARTSGSRVVGVARAARRDAPPASRPGSTASW